MFGSAFLCAARRILLRAALAGLFLAGAGTAAQCGGELDAWLGKPPLAQIGGQSMFAAAGLSENNVLLDGDRDPGTVWSGAQSAEAHYSVMGMQWSEYGYVFRKCVPPRCSGRGAANGVYFLAFNGPDYELFYAAKDYDKGTIAYCKYSNGWNCYDSRDRTLPSGSANQMAQAAYDRYDAQATARQTTQPSRHLSGYELCLQDHGEAYCRNVYNNGD
jgi:hypothetical protein